MVFKMEKLYIIESDNQTLINKEIDKIEKNIKGEFELIKYDLEINTIDDVIESLDTYGLFSNKKIVLAYNPPFLVQKQEDNLDKFFKYLDNPSDNILILITPKINNVLKVVKTINKYFKIIKLNDINLEGFVKDNLEDYKMDRMTLMYFLSKVSKDLNAILTELDKLKMYKLDSKVILKEDIDLVTRESFENTIFDLIEAIIKKDKKKSYELYNHFISSGTEIFQILVLVSNQIRLIYNVKVLNTISDSKISEILGVKEYPVKLARGKGINYSKKELLSLLHKLAILDQDIKSGKQLPNICFLTFVMEM